VHANKILKLLGMDNETFDFLEGLLWGDLDLGLDPGKEKLT
jgi:hypothetical protein